MPDESTEGSTDGVTEGAINVSVDDAIDGTVVRSEGAIERFENIKAPSPAPCSLAGTAEIVTVNIWCLIKLCFHLKSKIMSVRAICWVQISGLEVRWGNVRYELCAIRVRSALNCCAIHFR